MGGYRPLERVLGGPSRVDLEAVMGHMKAAAMVLSKSELVDVVRDDIAGLIIRDLKS